MGNAHHAASSDNDPVAVVGHLDAATLTPLAWRHSKSVTERSSERFVAGVARDERDARDRQRRRGELPGRPLKTQATMEFQRRFPDEAREDPMEVERRQRRRRRKTHKIRRRVQVGRDRHDRMSDRLFICGMAARSHTTNCRSGIPKRLDRRCAVSIVPGQHDQEQHGERHQLNAGHHDAEQDP